MKLILVLVTVLMLSNINSQNDFEKNQIKEDCLGRKYNQRDSIQLIINNFHDGFDLVSMDDYDGFVCHFYKNETEFPFIGFGDFNNDKEQDFVALLRNSDKKIEKTVVFLGENRTYTLDSMKVEEFTTLGEFGLRIKLVEEKELLYDIGTENEYVVKADYVNLEVFEKSNIVLFL